jgi:hypothetical protein
MGLELFQCAIADLVEYRRGLSSKLTPEEIRESMREKARQEGALILDWVPAIAAARNDRNLWLSDILHGLVDKVLEERMTTTVGDVVDWVDGLIPWEAWLLNYIEHAVQGERGIGVPDLLKGFSFRVNIPSSEGWSLPVMVAVATPFTPRKKWLADLSHKCQRELGALGRMKPASLTEAARCLPHWMAGTRSEEIADLLLTEDGYYDSLQAETEEKKADLYLDELTRRASRLRKLKARFLDAVTKVMAPTSQG